MDHDSAAQSLTEMMYLKRKQQQEQEGWLQDQDAAKSPYIGGQVLLSSLIDPAEHIKVGSFYEIDHSKLPQKFPDQLTSIRLVMVNEKTRMRVSLRYPSIYSLRAYFNESSYTLNTTTINYNSTYKPPPDAKKLPALDEKYTIGSEVAGEALYRRIPPGEISDKRHSWRFWARVPPLSPAQEAGDVLSPTLLGSRCDIVSKKGRSSLSLLSELKGSRMVKWGKRRVVQFLARHVEEENTKSSNDVAVVGSKLKGESEEEEEEEEKESGEEEEEGEDVKGIERSPDLRKHGKRGRGQGCSSVTPKKKRPKRENTRNKIVIYNDHQKKKRKSNRVVKNSIERWSADRYKLAEVNMLKVMKEKGAVIGNPILRPDLRTAARRLIGDTGLLDHLLKHMAGKVAPGGEERFRRRHNADGAMEYWLEKANLVDLRKEAGVDDPYWIPPPGWKPGDNPTQDPVCAREIKEIKEEIVKLKKYVEFFVSKKHGEELAIVTTPIASVASQTVEHDGSLIPLKEMYIDLMNKKAKIEEQLTEISESLVAMEEEMGRIGSQKSTPPTGAEREGRELMQREKALQEEHGKAGFQTQSSSTEPQVLSEDKAAKIDRLKSGFRMCKPQGTFLWPDMALSSPQFTAAPMPTSVSLSTTPTIQTNLFPDPSSSDLLSPASLVKPLAEIRPVAVCPSTMTTPIQTWDENQNITTSTTITTSRTTLINLNDPPDNQNDNLICGSQSLGHNSYFPVTYHRRHHNYSTSTVVIPCLPATKKEMRQWEEVEQKKEAMRRYCEQQQRGCSGASARSSCLSMAAASWLALATSNPSQDSISKRG